MGTTMAVLAADVIDCALRASSEFSRGFVVRGHAPHKAPPAL